MILRPRRWWEPQMGGVARSGPDLQRAGQIMSLEQIVPFQSFELTDNFLTRKQLYHFCCQAERMFSGARGKGEATPGA